MHVHLEKVEPVAGFIKDFTSDRQQINVVFSGGLISDTPEFYKHMEELTKIYFSSAEFLEKTQRTVDYMHQFLILVHSDLSADIYVNDFQVATTVRLKRDIENFEVGALIWHSDIADVHELDFPDIDIQDTDSVICCLKVGWKFLLYFNFVDRGRRTDLASMQIDLGRLHRYLRFQDVYRTLEAKACVQDMMDDGWFPFVEILGKDYEELAAAYQNERSAPDNTVRTLLDSFDESRIKGMTEKWWRNHLFREKRKFLQAGIEAFLRRTESDYISCIKNLYTEMEGILRFHYFQDTGEGSEIGQKQLIPHLIETGKCTAKSDDSLISPEQFLTYLTDHVFGNFNLETGSVELSRHSSSHGVAPAEDYTEAKALQALLILDQIYFFLPLPPSEPERN